MWTNKILEFANLLRPEQFSSAVQTRRYVGDLIVTLSLSDYKTTVAGRVKFLYAINYTADTNWLERLRRKLLQSQFQSW